MVKSEAKLEAECEVGDVSAIATSNLKDLSGMTTCRFDCTKQHLLARYRLCNTESEAIALVTHVGCLLLLLSRSQVQK